MPEIRVVFYEVVNGENETEPLIEYTTPSDPTYKKGDRISVIEDFRAGDSISSTEPEFIDATVMKKVIEQTKDATHEIVQTGTPVIVYTMNSDRSERSVFSRIHIYYLKKLEHKPGLPLSTIASMLP